MSALAVVLAAACGGKAAAPSTAPTAAPAEAGPADDAPLAMGGAAYGGDQYGEGHDPCDGGDPCGLAAMVGVAPMPQDPPALSQYLPPSTPAGKSPDPTAVYAVPVADSPTLGPATAGVTLVVTYEFLDPYSNRLREPLAELSTRYGKDLRIVWKSFIVHRDRAQVGALAGCAAEKQGKFRPFMNALLESATGPNGDRRADLARVQEVAAGQGLDAARFDKDLRSDACKQLVIRDQQLFESLGQQAVPVSYINGRVVQGAQPTEAFVTIIDEELAKAKAAIAKGTKPGKYYDGIVKSGRTTP